jgi:hypothetical protein
MIFVVPHAGYTYVVPFVIDPLERIVLKTIYPSRKYHKKFGGQNHEKA